MGKLVNINRAGGFPLCSETLKIIDENANLLESFLMSVVPMKSAVLIGNGYIYVRSTEYSGVAKLSNSSHISLSPGVKVDVSRMIHEVTDSNSNVYPDVYREYNAVLEPTSEPSEMWTVWRVNELFEVRKMRNLLSVFESGLANASISTQFYVGYPLALWSERNVLESNGTRCRMRLGLHVVFYASNDCMLRIPVPIDGNYPLNASLELRSTGKSDPVHANIKNGNIEIDLGRWVRDHNTNSSTFETIIRINNDLVL